MREKNMNMSKVANLPNCLSFLRIALTPLFLICVFSEGWYWNLIAFVVFTLASITDYFDGKLARKNGEITTLGRFLDPLADKILVTSALIAFVLNRLVVWWLIVPIILRDIYVTVMRLRSIHKGGVMTTSRLAKWKTATQLIVVISLLFLLGFKELVMFFSGSQLEVLGDDRVYLFANISMSLVLLLTMVSGLHYAFYAKHSVGRVGNKN